MWGAKLAVDGGGDRGTNHSAAAHKVQVGRFPGTVARQPWLPGSRLPAPDSHGGFTREAVAKLVAGFQKLLASALQANKINKIQVFIVAPGGERHRQRVSEREESAGGRTRRCTYVSRASRLYLYLGACMYMCVSVSAGTCTINVIGHIWSAASSVPGGFSRFPSPSPPRLPAATPKHRAERSIIGIAHRLSVASGCPSSTSTSASSSSWKPSQGAASMHRKQPPKTHWGAIDFGHRGWGWGWGCPRDVDVEERPRGGWEPKKAATGRLDDGTKGRMSVERVRMCPVLGLRPLRLSLESIRASNNIQSMYLHSLIPLKRTHNPLARGENQ